MEGMNDVLPDDRLHIIPAESSFSKKEMLNQDLTEDEKNKDFTPEVCQKPDSVPPQLLEKLSTGLLSFYIDDLKKTSSSLNELTRNQSIVIETLEQENSKVLDALKTYPLEEMFSKIKQYHLKAQQVKKDMIAIHERTSKLKKRAMKLQQQKQKEALQKEHQRDREIERDKQLAPKIAIKPPVK